jgi:hypothetical protein
MKLRRTLATFGMAGVLTVASAGAAFAQGRCNPDGTNTTTSAAASNTTPVLQAACQRAEAFFPVFNQQIQSAIDSLQNQVNAGQTANQTAAQFQALVNRLAKGQQWFTAIQGFEQQATNFCNSVLNAAPATA